MYPIPVAPVPGAPIVKPSLSGVRNKQRKGVQKANAKFEPIVFRDQLVKHLESVPTGDSFYDSIATKLDLLGSQLDYRKYEQELFEILLVGGILAPGGGFLEDGSAQSAFSVLGSAKEPVEVADMKKVVYVFDKLMRRYKYLQKPFEETALKGVLQYINKFTLIEQEKLALSSALFVSTGLASSSILNSLKKDHLVKDGIALDFFTKFLKAYLLTEPLEHLSSSLKRGGTTDLAEFFPSAKQNSIDLAAHFKDAGLVGVMEFYTKQKEGAAKGETLYRLKELVADESDDEELLNYLTAQNKLGVIAPSDFIAIIWHGLLSGLDMGSRPDQINDLVVKAIARIAPILEEFCTKAPTEVALINTIQVWAYENTKVMPAFPKILKVLYSTDVLSDQAIIYWHSKGSKAEARQHFLKATESLVTFLKEQEDESEEDE